MDSTLIACMLGAMAVSTVFGWIGGYFFGKAAGTEQTTRKFQNLQRGPATIGSLRFLK